ncbi:MAG: universal stress protein [Acidobacteria bacterium]|nr:universal stress protein [Acidobacteriota bacterium]
MKVLVPMDFSPPARLALNYGIAFARKFRSRLTVLHVVESGTALTYAFPTEAARIEQEHAEQARRMLSTLLAPEDENDLDLRTVVKVGDIEGQILATIQDEQIDIVVMGTHGRGLVGRVLIGSLAEKMLRKVEAPQQKIDIQAVTAEKTVPATISQSG